MTWFKESKGYWCSQRSKFYESMSCLTSFKILFALIFLWLTIKELIIIAKKVNVDTYQASNDIFYEKLKPAAITLCPGNAYKKPEPFLSYEDFNNSIYHWDDIFHPSTLTALFNESMFKTQRTFSFYFGVCFTFQKLQEVSDSFLYVHL